jgi:pyroglutamyl-peptidase
MSFSRVLRVLVTGFEPFGEGRVNPSQILCQQLREKSTLIQVPAGLEVRAVVLPVTFASSYGLLAEEIKTFRPDAVICLGLASARTAIEIERIAVNLIAADVLDNDGFAPTSDTPIDPSAETAFFSTLPLKAIVSRLRSEGIDARISETAGLYVCNFVFYQLMRNHRLHLQAAGFIHLPPLTDDGREQARALGLVFDELRQLMKN